VSGEALRMIRLTGPPYLNWVFTSSYTTLEFAANIFGIYYVWPSTAVLLFTIYSALLIPLMVLILGKDTLMRTLAGSLDFLIISAAAYYAFYWFYELGLRDWYSLFTSFLVTVVFSTAIVALIQRVHLGKLRQTIYIALVGVLASAFIGSGILKYEEGNYPQEKLKWEVARYIETNIPAKETIGAFNTGIYQYYTENHDVINLDGVINPEAHEAMKNRDIEGYILRKGIDYIADPPKYVEGLDRSILKIEAIRTFEMSCSRCPKSAKGELEIGLFRVTRP